MRQEVQPHSHIVEQLRRMLKKGEPTNEVIEWVKNVSVKNVGAISHIVYQFICMKSINKNLVEKSLNIFLDARRQNHMEHSHFIGGLSTITHPLWKSEMYDWLKKLYFLALDTAIKTKNAYGCNRLVEDFCRHAKWNKDPSDFGITHDVLHLIKQDGFQEGGQYLSLHCIKRLLEGRFKSERQYLRWVCSLKPSEQWHREQAEEAKTRLAELRGGSAIYPSTSNQNGVAKGVG
ncbi:MAG: hypothetical protein OXU73_01065 [Candidatus Campbellbacteria bacterium]|nr:hypothetical protein [Candidatus Campbellbacteria bacterium]